MYENRQIKPCKTCGRKIMEPKVFCNKNCEEYQNMDFFGSNYENYYKPAFWRVVAGSEDYPKGSLYVG